jgi:hypothetical protein
MDQLYAASRIVKLVRELATFGVRFVVFDDYAHNVLLRRKEVFDDNLGVKSNAVNIEPGRILLEVRHCGLAVCGVPVGYMVYGTSKPALSSSVSVGSFGTIG